MPVDIEEHNFHDDGLIRQNEDNQNYDGNNDYVEGLAEQRRIVNTYFNM